MKMINGHLGTCRFCKVYAVGLVYYSTRHYAHADCLLKAKGVKALDSLSDWQLEKFPALVAKRHGLLEELGRRIDANRVRKAAREAAREP